MRTLALLGLGGFALTWPADARVAAQAPSQPPQVATADPVADPAATVVDGHARFTVLTPRLVRMEWSAGGHFEDRRSLVFIQRRLAVPPHTVRRAGGWLTVQTDDLTLRYRRGSGRFGPGNLEVRLRADGRDVVWRPGESDSANLKGTTRTLDGAKGPVPLEPGLLSRAGWAVVDDSRRPLFDQSAWPWVVARPAGERQDLYFFGYGHDYKGALADFITVAGRVPMPPRFAFGAWWSRYWAYTDQEFTDLVRQFDRFDVPLDVLVIDMDWHNTFELRWENAPKDQAGQAKGWTGYDLDWQRLVLGPLQRMLELDGQRCEDSVPVGGCIVPLVVFDGDRRLLVAAYHGLLDREAAGLASPIAQVADTRDDVELKLINEFVLSRNLPLAYQQVKDTLVGRVPE
jgi:hypothetical protein